VTATAALAETRKADSALHAADPDSISVTYQYFVASYSSSNEKHTESEIWKTISRKTGGAAP
jgi:hypothetical protein